MAGEPILLAEPELQDLLLQQAEDVSRYVAKRIPRRFRALIPAEDVLQEIWITAFQTVGGFRFNGPGSFKRWLTAIANRRLADSLRAAGASRRGGAEFILRGDLPRQTSLGDLFSQLASLEKTPSRELSTREAVRAVQIALGGLEEPRRRAITMRHIEGRSCQEIARAMQRSDAAVNSLIYQGMRELRKRLRHARRFFSDAKSWSGCHPTSAAARDRLCGA